MGSDALGGDGATGTFECLGKFPGQLEKLRLESGGNVHQVIEMA
ncbi:hypothetical protein [uncultured Pleomorphomonas sp.]|nr:hypothetical protein [uncultured Pleomorphomonas sp.]